MAEEKKYYIRVRGALVQVTSEVYKACHQAKRRVKTLYEKDERNKLVSYDAMDTDDTLGEEMIPDQSLPSVEDSALKRLLIRQLHQCLAQLSDADQQLLHALYFEHLSERKFADLTGVHYMTVHSRKASLLRKLKKMMEN